MPDCKVSVPQSPPPKCPKFPHLREGGRAIFQSKRGMFDGRPRPCIIKWIAPRGQNGIVVFMDVEKKEQRTVSLYSLRMVEE